MIKLQCSLGQSFGGNSVATYKAGGLLGHTGVDNQCGYGTPIHAYFGNEYVYKVLTREKNDNQDGFTGVFTIVDNGTECFEFLYGHCNPSVTVGQILTKGEALGTEANNGEVYIPSGNGTFTRITLAMQKAGDQRGAHRHDQKRILKKSKSWSAHKKYLSALGGGSFFKDGFYYEIPFYENGYNGCVNFLLPLFTRDLFFGRTGYDVLCLQRFLKKTGYLQIEEPTEFFGKATLGAVMAFQKANGISPIGGYVGVKTRQLINSLI